MIDKNIVNLIIFAVMLYIVIRTWIDNKKLYEYIETECKNIEDTQSFIQINNIIREKTTRNTTIKINVETMVEEYISNKKDEKGRKILENIKVIKGRPSMLIIMGVLGTFIGLVIGLSSLSINGEMDDIVNQIPAFLAGVHTAFATSIGGIISSLVLQYQINKYPCEGELVRWMLKLEIAINEGIQDEEKKLNKQFIQHTSNILEKLNKSVPLQEEIKNQIYVISEGIGELNNGFKALKELKRVAKDLNTFNTVFGQRISEFTGGMSKSLDMMNDFTNKIAQMGMLFEGLHQDMDNQYQINVGIRNYIEEAQQYLQNATNVIMQQYNIHKVTYDEMIGQLIDVKNQVKEELQQVKEFEVDKQDNLKKVIGQIQYFIKEQNSNEQIIHSKMQDSIENSFNQICYKLDQTIEPIASSMTDLQKPLTLFAGMIPERINKLEQDLRMQIDGHGNVLENIVEKQKEHLEYNRRSLNHMIVTFGDSLRRGEKHFIEELDNHRETINKGFEDKDLLIKEHVELVEKLNLLTKSVETSIGNIDKNFVNSVEVTLNKFKIYVERTNKILEDKINMLYDGYLVDKLVSAIEQVEKE